MSAAERDPGVITIERHILNEQASFPDASGALTSLLQDVALSGKLIASRTTRAGLADILGSALGGGRSANASDGGGLGDLIGGFLDADNDGSVLDDLLGMAGRFMR